MNRVKWNNPGSNNDLQGFVVKITPSESPILLTLIITDLKHHPPSDLTKKKQNYTWVAILVILCSFVASYSLG